MIVTLLEKGWFNDPKKSAIESALTSNFADAIRLISTENASR